MWTLENDELPYIFDEKGEPIAVVVDPAVQKLLLAAPVLLAALTALEEAARQVMSGEMAASSIQIERMTAQDAIKLASGDS